MCGANPHLRILENISVKIGGESVAENVNDSIIRASINAGRTRTDIIKTWEDIGLIGVYNLGASDMYSYITSLKINKSEDKVNNSEH